MESEVVLNGNVYISSGVAAELSGYTRDYVGQLAREGRVEFTKVGRSIYVDKHSLLEYIRANAGGASELNDTDAKSVVRDMRAAVVTGELQTVAHSAQKLPSQFFGAAHQSGNIVAGQTHPAPRGGVRLFKKAVALTLALTLVFGSVTAYEYLTSGEVRTFAVMSQGVVRASGGLSRGVGSAMSAVPASSTVRAFVDPLALAVYELVIRLVGGDSAQGGREYARGFVVLPQGDEDTILSNIHNTVRESFSDEVTVSVDETGTSGTVTPVFKQGEGDEYIFMMVPVRDQQGGP